MASSEFNSWLNEKLREINTDENVFGSYITGILDGEESTEEKIEALEDILREIIEEDDLSPLINDIIKKWDIFHPKIDEKKGAAQIDVDAQLAKILESQKLQTTVQRQYTAEELRIREQILAQYSQTEVSGDDDDEEPEEPTEETGGLVKNTNFHDVQQANKERREQAKMDSQKKKEKDKEDREKQKQLKEEKKEKRKTVKGERRR